MQYSTAADHLRYSTITYKPSTSKRLQTTILILVSQSKKSMSWASHINTILLEASRILNFINQNLYMCSKEVKETAYLTLIRLS